MAVRQYQPTSPGRRFQSVSDFREITKSKPHKALVERAPKSGGRNNNGRITTRHRGGGHKRLYRIIDFKRRDKEGIEAMVESIEYDPNRSVRIALLLYRDGERRYILAPTLLKKDHKVVSGPAADFRPGNSMEIGRIPGGTLVHNIELKVGKGGQLVRSAGASAQGHGS